MHGVLVIDKPTGLTSHDVVAHVRRAIGLRRIGHTGTLDPIATGVLPLVLGRATRLAPFLSATTKTYDAVFRLGMVTDTYDVTGNVGRTAGGPTSRLADSRGGARRVSRNHLAAASSVFGQEDRRRAGV